MHLSYFFFIVDYSVYGNIESEEVSPSRPHLLPQEWKRKPDNCSEKPFRRAWILNRDPLVMNSAEPPGIPFPFVPPKGKNSYIFIYGGMNLQGVFERFGVFKHVQVRTCFIFREERGIRNKRRKKYPHSSGKKFRKKKYSYSFSFFFFALIIEKKEA